MAGKYVNVVKMRRGSNRSQEFISISLGKPHVPYTKECGSGHPKSPIKALDHHH